MMKSSLIPCSPFIIHGSGTCCFSYQKPWKCFVPLFVSTHCRLKTLKCFHIQKVINNLIGKFSLWCFEPRQNRGGMRLTTSWEILHFDFFSSSKQKRYNFCKKSNTKALWRAQLIAFQVSKCVQLPKSWKTKPAFQTAVWQWKKKGKKKSLYAKYCTVKFGVLTTSNIWDFCLWTEISSTPNKNQATFSEFISFEGNHDGKSFLTRCSMLHRLISGRRKVTRILTVTLPRWKVLVLQTGSQLCHNLPLQRSQFSLWLAFAETLRARRLPCQGISLTWCQLVSVTASLQTSQPAVWDWRHLEIRWLVAPQSLEPRVPRGWEKREVFWEKMAFTGPQRLVFSVPWLLDHIHEQAQCHLDRWT